MRHLALHTIQIQCWKKIQVHGDAAVLAQGLSDAAPCGIDQTALQPIGGEHTLAQALKSRGSCRGVTASRNQEPDAFERRPGEALAQQGAPQWRDLKTTVGRLQAFDCNALALQGGHPSAIRTQPGPAGAPQSQQARIGLYRQRHLWRFEMPELRLSRRPTHPARPGVKPHTLLAQTVHPGPQQRGGLHFTGKYPARTADEGGYTQALRPISQSLR